MGDMEVSPIAHVIQLSVAPVFVLSGLAFFLGLLWFPKREYKCASRRL